MMAKIKNKKTSLLKNIVKAVPAVIAVVAVTFVVQLIREIDAPVLLPVNEVQVEGELHLLDINEISVRVKENVSGGYFAIDLNHIRDILMQEPWIQEVSLRRKWPAGVTVYIEEQKPVAYWNAEGYINKSGDVFKPAAFDRQLSLPKLQGPEGMHKNVWQFMNVLYQQTASLDYEVKSLQLDDRRAWQFVITSNVDTVEAEQKNEIDVRLGRFETEKRMQRFVRVLPALTVKKNNEQKIKAIDMRYPNGFAVQMNEAENNDEKV